MPEDLCEPALETPEALEEHLSRPSSRATKAIAQTQGDILLLGAGGKMGPTLARMAKRAVNDAGVDKKVVAVSRFSDAGICEQLERSGIETIAADLLDQQAIDRLPDAGAVIYLVGRKFGSTENTSLTWATNAFLPGLVARRFASARIVALSSGNVYPFVAIDSGGADESVTPGPVGQYAQSCLAREQVFDYFCRSNHTPVCLIRLNYANDLRYGVLLDVALLVKNRQPIDLAMGFVNVIWGGDANAAVLSALSACKTPPHIFNIAGQEAVAIRDVAERFGQLLDRKPIFIGTETSTSLLSDAERYCRELGGPAISVEQMIRWIAHWLKIGGPTMNKPTHFQTRDGKF